MPGAIQQSCGASAELAALVAKRQGELRRVGGPAIGSWRGFDHVTDARSRAAVATGREDHRSRSAVETPVEYGVVPLGQPCRGSSRQVRWSETALLAGVCALDLGATRSVHAIRRKAEAGMASTTDTSVDLAVTLDSAYRVRDDVPQDLAFRHYLRRYSSARTVAWNLVQSNLDIEPANRVTGLYWTDGWGYYHRALMHALALLHTYADLAEQATGARECLVEANRLRLDIEEGRVFVQATWAIGCDNACAAGLEVTPKGRVNPFLDDCGPGGYTIPVVGPIILCNWMGTHAALADYYFWWARRLYSYRLDTGLEWYGFLGQCAARAGMSEIVALSGTILHEYGHQMGVLDHCASVGQVDPFWCCHYTMDATFRHAVSAVLALPRGQIYGSSPISAYNAITTGWRAPVARAGRFDYDGDEGWRFVGTFNTSQPECDPWRVVVEHCRFWQEDHAVQWRVGLPQKAAPCVTNGNVRLRHAELPGRCGDDGGSSGDGSGRPPNFDFDMPRDPPWGRPPADDLEPLDEPGVNR